MYAGTIAEDFGPRYWLHVDHENMQQNAPL